MVDEEKLRRKLQQLRLQRMQIERHMLHLERRLAMQGSAPALRRELERLDERRSKLIEQEEQMLKRLSGEPAREELQAAPSAEEAQSAEVAPEQVGEVVSAEAQMAAEAGEGERKRIRRRGRARQRAGGKGGAE